MPFTSKDVQTRWLKILGTNSLEVLKKRLNWDGFNLDDVDLALKAMASSLDFNDPISASRPSVKTRLNKPKQLPNVQLAFQDLLYPLIPSALTQLDQSISALKLPPLCRSVKSHLSKDLLSRLCAVGAEPLWTLYQQDRGAGPSLLAALGILSQKTNPPKTTAYTQFVQKHLCDSLKTLFSEFPILHSFVLKVVDFWIQSSRETLIRIHHDRALLTKEFDIPINARLTEIKCGLGDHHRGGRSVSFLTFSDGGHDWKIVYKPRDVRIDATLQTLLDDTTALGKLPSLASLKVLCGDGYGYMEYIEPKPCKDVAELGKFYHNSGRLSAVLYLLGCTDGHHENLIAHGPELHLIDGETLLSPTPKSDVQSKNTNENKLDQDSLRPQFDASLVRTALFPFWQFHGDAIIAFDPSTFGAETSGRVALKELIWVHIATDEMARGRENVAPLPLSCVPVSKQQPNPFPLHLDAFKQGFFDQCTAIRSNKPNWLCKEGILARFNNLTGRAVVRATRIYSNLQSQQLTSSALNSSMGQCFALEPLARLYLTSPSKPQNWPVLASEQGQMAQLDIPYFTHQPDKPHLMANQPEPLVKDYFVKSGVDVGGGRIVKLNDETIAFQLEVIDGLTRAKPLRRQS